MPVMTSMLTNSAPRSLRDHRSSCRILVGSWSETGMVGSSPARFLTTSTDFSESNFVHELNATRQMTRKMNFSERVPQHVMLANKFEMHSGSCSELRTSSLSGTLVKDPATLQPPQRLWPQLIAALLPFWQRPLGSPNGLFCAWRLGSNFSTKMLQLLLQLAVLLPQVLGFLVSVLGRFDGCTIDLAHNHVPVGVLDACYCHRLHAFTCTDIVVPEGKRAKCSC